MATLLKGIDISNNQKDIKIANLPALDFIIAKVSEGKTFKDVYFDGFIKAAKAKGIKRLGGYHFAGTNDAKAEADYFYSLIKPYLSEVVPILDYEVWNKNTNDIKWCKTFIDRFHELSGIYCMLYISASRCAQFKNSGIATHSKLWVAGYPKKYTKWATDSTVPYAVSPWKAAYIWQFTSAGRLSGYDGNLDLNYCYDDSIWNNVTNSNNSSNANSGSNASNSSASKSPFKGKGTYKCIASSVNIRTGAGTNYQKVGRYSKGQTVNLGNWSKVANGYVWGRYIGSSSGAYRYVALGTSDGKKIYFEKI